MTPEPTKRPIRYGCVCSGISAPTVAWKALGWECQFFAEIEPAPSAVLRHHYPTVRNLGDFTGIRNRWIRRLGIGSIDVLVGGTPCQGFSVAGLRGGLADPRSSLALEFLRLARRLRPTWVVWENVPGVLSTNGGRDFGAFLGGLAELGYGWAYRVLDAQHFGVPQRRRRVFVVGYSGDPRRLAGSPSREDIQRFSRISAAVLFERHCLSGNSPPSREAGTVVTGCLTGGTGSSSAGNPDDNRAQANFMIPGTPAVARERTSHGGRLDGDTETFIAQVAHTLRGEGFDGSEDGTGRSTPLVPVISPTLFASNGGVSSGYHPVVPARSFAVQEDNQNGVTMRDTAGSLRADAPGTQPCGTLVFHEPIPIDLRQASRGEKLTNNRATGSGGPPGIGVGSEGDPAFTVSERGQAIAFNIIGGGQTSNRHAYEASVSGCLQHKRLAASGDEACPLIAEPVAFNWQGGGKQTSIGFDPDSGTTGTLHVGQTPAIAFQERGREGGRSCEHQVELAYSLNAPNGGGRRHEMNIASRTEVRRLTPVECERLQGFADDYTLVRHCGKPMADGPRYRMTGNSMAVPCKRWIGQRLELVDAFVRSINTPAEQFSRTQ